MESRKISTSMDWMKSLIPSSKKVTDYNRHLKKTEDLLLKHEHNNQDQYTHLNKKAYKNGENNL